jgi:hypothetical protein
MERRVHGAVHYVGSALGEVVHHAEDGFLIAGDDARAENDSVARLDGEVLVIINGDAGEGGHGFALGSGDQDSELRGGAFHGVLGAEENAVRYVEKAEIVGDFRDRDHGASDDRDFAAELLGEVDDLLQPVNGGTEAGNDEAALGAIEEIFEAGADSAFGIGVAGTVGVGGVGEEEKDAALAVVGKGVEVEKLVVCGGRVDFVVAGVDDHAKGGGNGQCDGADDRVGDVDELDLKRPNLNDFLGPDSSELDLVVEVELFEAAFDQGAGESSGVDGNVKLTDEVRNRSYMVLVAVGKDKGADGVPVLLEETQVRCNNIDAKEFVLGKHHAAVNDDSVLAIAYRHDVHAEFAEAAEGNDLKFLVSAHCIES